MLKTLDWAGASLSPANLDFSTRDFSTPDRSANPYGMLNQPLDAPQGLLFAEAASVWRGWQERSMGGDLDAQDLTGILRDRLLPPTPENQATLENRSSSLDSLLGNSTQLVGPAAETEAIATDAAPTFQAWSGTLSADTFTIDPTVALTLVSGNGNVDFGEGARDTLDLSSFLFSAVSFNPASATSGVVFDPGNGARVFDAIAFDNGSQVLFEGIDSVIFGDLTLDLFVEPNDPLFGDQWNLHMMGVHNAWRFTTGSDQVLVGIEDTGLTYRFGSTHTDLRPTDTLGSQARDESYLGGYSHGTAVQSIIAANSNNGEQMSGINWQSPVFNIDVLGGEWGDLSLAEATQVMIDEAASQGQQLVINMSLGVPQSFNESFDPAFEAVVASHPNVLFVIAAGNDGDLGIEGLSSPAFLAATYDNVIAVGASWGETDMFGNERTPGDRIEYSDFWGSQYGQGLTLMGPSEVIAANTGWQGFGTQTLFNGTSAATPNVTGVASLVWSANPTLTAAEVKQILSQTAVDLSTPGYDLYTGSGMVNADAAVRQALAWGREVDVVI